MTNTEYRLKYPIGTKIRFLYKSADTNKIGTIVGFRYDDRPIIYLPTADKHLSGKHPTLDDGTKFTWKCEWDEVELLIGNNEQLLFAFMEQENE